MEVDYFVGEHHVTGNVTEGPTDMEIDEMEVVSPASEDMDMDWEWNEVQEDTMLVDEPMDMDIDYSQMVQEQHAHVEVQALEVLNMLIMGERENEVVAVKNLLSTEYKMKDIGEVDVVLGMRVKRSIKEGWLTIDQEDYTKEILKKFGMWESKAHEIPMRTDVKLS